MPGIVEGAHGGAGVLVVVTLHGRRYLFKVDTGAARTVIYSSVIRMLGLRHRGGPETASPIGCHIAVQPVAVSDWKLGSVSLPPLTVVAQPAPRQLDGERFGGLPARFDGLPYGGLLGADVLARLHSITLDFAADRVIVGARTVRSGQSAPITTISFADGAIEVLARATIHGDPGRYLIDTGSPTTLLVARPPTESLLPVISRGLRVSGATGCSAPVSGVRIADWTIGSVPMPSVIAYSSKTAFVAPAHAKSAGGLIGADVMSAFSQVTIDFANKRLVFGGKIG